MIKALKYLIITAAIIVISAQGVYAERIKDIARIKSARENIVSGVGIITGLAGTGDSTESFASLALYNLLRQNGFELNDKAIKSKNIAAVRVSAVIGPDKKEGSRTEVVVSSIGDAKSLQGGYLEEAYLYGPDNSLYAIAYGSIHIDETKKILTVANIPNGAIIEEEIPTTLLDNEGNITYVLSTPDYTTASEIAGAIRNAYNLVGIKEDEREKFTKGVKVVNAGEIKIEVPQSWLERLPEFIAVIEGIYIAAVDVEAKVVINEREQTVAINGNVRVKEVAVCVEGVEINVPAKTGTVENPEKDYVAAINAESVALKDLVKSLNDIGVNAKTLIKIIKAIHDAGALQGKLEVK